MASTEPARTDHGDQQPVLGSGEPLTPEETADRLRALAAWGVDLSLIRASLELTPTERLQRMTDFLAIGAALHQSYLDMTQGEPEPPHEATQ